VAIELATYPGLQNLNVYQGDTFQRRWKFQTNTNGVIAPMSLSGYDIKAQIKRVRGSNVNVIYTSSTNNGDIVVSNTSYDVVTWTIGKSNMANIPVASLVYDFRVSNATVETSYMTGQFTVTAEVTT
jgi:hypothetical protein